MQCLWMRMNEWQRWCRERRGFSATQLCAKWMLYCSLGFQLRVDAEAHTTTQPKIRSLSYVFDFMDRLLRKIVISTTKISRTVDQALVCFMEENTGIWENKLHFVYSLKDLCVSGKNYIVYLILMCGSMMKLQDRSSRQNKILTKWKKHPCLKYLRTKHYGNGIKRLVLCSSI